MGEPKPERYVVADDEGTLETEIVHTPDGTFTRDRFKKHVDQKTGQPVFGRWSPWFSALSARNAPTERVFLAQD